MRSSHLAIRSVFQERRFTCQVPRKNAVMGMMARMMRPGPWRFPVRTSSGGLSTMDWKPGSSAGWRRGSPWRRGGEVVNFLGVDGLSVEVG